MTLPPEFRHTLVEAYATGWALSGGPMTPRVKAGLTAALHVAEQQTPSEELVEVTLHLGHLEGVWAEIYRRREEIYTTAAALITGLWRRIARRLRTTDTVRAMRHTLADLPTTPPSPAQLERAAEAAARELLRPAAEDPAWAEITTVLAGALRQAEAEGRAGALALAADKHSATLDLDAAYKDSYTRLDDTARYQAQAEAWGRRILAATVNALARTLRSHGVKGTARDDTVTAVNTLLGAGEAPALSVVGGVDMAVSQAMDRGARALYALYNATQMLYVTAGDDGVCHPCLALEDANPYTITDCPTPGWHPKCRCITVAEDAEIPASVFTLFLVPTPTMPDAADDTGTDVTDGGGTGVVPSAA